MPDFYTIQDVLSFAIRLEQASREFYQQLSWKTHKRSVSQFLMSLVKEEQLHKAKLQKLLDDQEGVLGKSISAKEVSRYVQAVHVPESLDYKEAIKLAMNKEKSAQMLYSIVAGRADITRQLPTDRTFVPSDQLGNV